MPKIILNAPRQGIAQSPHVGFADVRNMDIDSIEGIARLNNLMAKKSATTVDAQVKWLARDPDTPAEVRALDSNGVLYESSNSGATWSEIDNGAGAGQGLIIKWGYAFVCKETKIEVFKISDDSETADWQTIDTEFVRFNAALFTEDQPQPNQKSINEHFEKYKDNFPGEATDDNPYGFGYKLDDLFCVATNSRRDD